MMAATHKDTDGERVLDKTLPEALQKWVGVHPDKVHVSRACSVYSARFFRCDREVDRTISVDFDR